MSMLQENLILLTFLLKNLKIRKKILLSQVISV